MGSGSLALEVFYKLLDFLKLGGGEAVCELLHCSVEVGGDAVRGRGFYYVLDKAENGNVVQIGSFEAEGWICGVERVELDVACAVGDLFYESLVTVEDDGYAAAIDATLLMHLDDVAVLDLGGHTIARDLDAEGIGCFAIGEDIH